MTNDVCDRRNLELRVAVPVDKRNIECHVSEVKILL
jgi:hypothetical protein